MRFYSKITTPFYKPKSGFHQLQVVLKYSRISFLSEKYCFHRNQISWHKQSIGLKIAIKKENTRLADRRKSTLPSLSTKKGIPSLPYDYPLVKINEDGSELSVDFFDKESDTSESREYNRIDDESQVSKQSSFHAPWLWSNCPNNIHFTGARLRTPGQYSGTKILDAGIISASDLINDPSSNGTNTSLSNIPTPPPPKYSCHPISEPFLNGGETTHEEVENEEQLFLCVSWDDYSPDSYFDMNWLEQWRYDIQTLNRRKKRNEIDSNRAIQFGDELSRFSFDEIISKSNDDAVYDLLHAVFQVGAVIITSVPNLEGDKTSAVKAIASATAGSTSHGHLYGDAFHVIDKSSEESANNIAYTSEALVPHQDLSYYESKPGLQLLHCVEFSDDVIGGETVLVDALAAAAELRRIAPHHFRTLVSCSATFLKQREDVCMTYLQPHIVLQPNKIPPLRDNSKNSTLTDDIFDSEIVAVNWSPPFEGPLCIRPEMIQNYYDAYAAFEQMIDFTIPPEHAAEKKNNNFDEMSQKQIYSDYARRFIWKYRLKPGEMLVFNNQRLLHGRTGCSGATNVCSNANSFSYSRHLIGAYTNIDDTLNRYKVLHYQRKRGNSRDICNVGNRSSIIP